MNEKAKLTILGALALLSAVTATMYVGSAYLMRAPTPEATKEVIKAQFLADYRGFDFERASELLSESRVENEYAVCSIGTEATAEQYIEMSRAIDKYGNQSPGLRIAMNTALKGDGVSDCDYRVMATLIWTISSGEKAELSVAGSASVVSSGANP